MHLFIYAEDSVIRIGKLNKNTEIIKRLEDFLKQHPSEKYHQLLDTHNTKQNSYQILLLIKL